LLNKDATLLAEWKALTTAAERGAFVEKLKGLSEIDGFLAKYANLRKYIGDGIVKAHLNSTELVDFGKVLKTAHPDVLAHINSFKNADEFAEMVRGYKDLLTKNPTTFVNAIKSFNTFEYWLKYWKMVPVIENSLNTLRVQLKGKLLPIGNTKEIQLANIQAFTVNGDFLNIPLRYNATWFGEYNLRAIKHIKEGLDELRKVPGRKIVNEFVFSGKTYSLADFNTIFVNGIGKEVPFTGFVSSSKLESVAEGFVDLSKQWVNSPDKVAVIRRIISKEGVYIDDISDWGKNLGKARHSNEPIAIQIQEEVLMNEGLFKQTSNPTLYKVVNNVSYYYVDFVELVKPLK
jgi:hypothetical protein